jgi:hypothetical protein
MPIFKNKEVSFTFDLYGCPNRCRHCWLGCATGQRLPKNEAYNEFEIIREHVDSGSERPHLEKVKYFGSWFREPHYSDDYKELYEAELKYNHGFSTDKDYELLSIWRLANDEGYAKWAKEVFGAERCQITFFGMEESNDWFYRRKGAFRDAIAATERLIEVGIKPRWQLIQTKEIIPELGSFLKLVDKLRLRDRVAALGEPFDLFMHDPGPSGEARKIEHLRLTRDDMQKIPRELDEYMIHHYGKPVHYHTEKYWMDIITKEEENPIGFTCPDKLWFYVTTDWNVFSNIDSGTLEPWRRLGNLKTDKLADIFCTFRENGNIAFDTLDRMSAREIASSLGKQGSNKIYMSKSDLIELYVEEYCERRYQGTYLSV